MIGIGIGQYNCRGYGIEKKFLVGIAGLKNAIGDLPSKYSGEYYVAFIRTSPVLPFLVGAALRKLNAIKLT